MSAQNQDEGTQTALMIVVPLLVLVIGFVLGIAIQTSNKARAAKAAPAVVAVAAPAATEAGDASVVVENGVVKFYFASGKADLASGAAAALTDAVAAAAKGKKLVISGFHDATGNAEFNAELAKQRALAVRDALKAAGVSELNVELKKPEELAGTGSDAQARRVEVNIQ